MPVYNTCQWCQNRPGGCLYCVDDLDNPQAKITALEGMLQRGEIHQVAIKYDLNGRISKVLVRQMHADGTTSRVVPVGRVPSPGVPTPINLPCIDHHWTLDPQNFHRRTCTNCPAEERFQWDPASPDRQGEWKSIHAAPVRRPRASRPKPHASL